MDSIAQSMGIDPDDASRLKKIALFIVTLRLLLPDRRYLYLSEVLITQARRFI